MPSIPERVAKGVALLDKTLAGWDGRIDLDRLDLSSTCDCILGQEFEAHSDVDMDDDWSGSSPFDVGVRELFTRWFVDAEQEARLHGFNAIGSTAEEFDALEAEWRRVILARRGGAR